MIGAIKSELRKSRRPAVLVSALVLAAITILFYSANWYLALHPGGPREAVSLLTLYPDQFVNNIMGAAFPIGAAVAIVLGAILAGSEYGWNTLKSTLTQGPGRLTVWAGRIVVFLLLMALMAAVLFAIDRRYATTFVTWALVANTNLFILYGADGFGFKSSGFGAVDLALVVSVVNVLIFAVFFGEAIRIQDRERARKA